MEKTNTSISAPLCLLILGSRADGRSTVFFGTEQELHECEDEWEKSHSNTGWMVCRQFFTEDDRETTWMEVYMPKRRLALINKLKKLCSTDPVGSIPI